MDDNNRVYRLSMALKTSVVTKFLFILTKHTGANCNKPVEPTKDWSSYCLEGQNLLVVEVCGVLGRLHSAEGLAQSSNNAKLSKDAKHITKATDYMCESEGASSRG
jgi:hypothetical protein